MPLANLDSRKAEKALVNFIAEYTHDPLGFVLAAFPWGEPGSDLQSESGPDTWQRDIMGRIKDGLLTANEAIQLAVASGHGVGKSALVAWLVLWAISTCEDCKGVVTANTEVQLKTKTWAEIAKWYRLLLCKHWFQMTATALFSADIKHEKTWRIDMVPWSENRTEAFAGLHNQGKRVILIFDEASAIPDVIWEVSEGVTTDQNTEIIWAAFGNPTRNTGRFKECFGAGRFAHRWKQLQVDGRTAKVTNKAKLDQWVTDYGEDSDFVRVRVRGVFPRAGTTQLIAQDIVQDARKNTLHDNKLIPVILSLDVARFGSNKTVPCIRCGRKAKILGKWRGYDTVKSAECFIKLIEQYEPDAIVVDEDGIGGAIVDVLRSRKYDRRAGKEILYGFRGGKAAIDEAKYYNRRAEVYCTMERWFRDEHPDIDDDPELEMELIGPEYGLDSKGRFQLETKDHMEDRGLESPDMADALAMTFAVKINYRHKVKDLDQDRETQEQYSMVANQTISWMN